MIRIIADSYIPFIKNVLEPFARIEYIPGEEIKNQDLKNIDALIIRTRTKCDTGLLKGTGIRFIASATIGTDHIDLDYCSENNIVVENAPGCNSASVCQYIMSSLITIAKNHNLSLRNKTIGIVGHGNVGSKVAHFAKILGMNVLLNDPPKQLKKSETDYVSLDEILNNADIISLHVPLTRLGQHKTFKMVDIDFISKMSPNQVLINSSRGGVVDEDILKSALLSGKIRSTVLDVWENEPNIDSELLDITELGTPHIAGYSVDGKANGSAIVINLINDYFNFGLINWYPEDLQVPENSIIHPETSNKTDEAILHDALLNTYDILTNSNTLKNDPSKFELLRYKHPVRREYQNFKVNTSNLSGTLIKQFKNLGFKTI